MKTSFKEILFILSVILYVVSFKTLKTNALKQKDARKMQEKWQKSLEIQRELDKEHASGCGIRYIDNVRKYYEPYTSETVRNS